MLKSLTSNHISHVLCMNGTSTNCSSRKMLNIIQCYLRVLLTNITAVIKSKNMRWKGRVTCTGEIQRAYKILLGIREGQLRRFR